MKKILIVSVAALALTLAACKDDAKKVVDQVGTTIQSVLDRIAAAKATSDAEKAEYKKQVQAAFEVFKSDCASEGGSIARAPEGRAPGVVCVMPDGSRVPFKFEPASTPNVTVDNPAPAETAPAPSTEGSTSDVPASEGQTGSDVPASEGVQK